MPWFGWIAIIAIAVFGTLQVVSMISGRPIPWDSEDADTDELEERVRELEKKLESGQIEPPRVPSRSEENLAAEDRWRLDMLETRLENLEAAEDAPRRPSPEDPPEDPSEDPQPRPGTTA